MAVVHHSHRWHQNNIHAQAMEVPSGMYRLGILAVTRDPAQLEIAGQVFPGETAQRLARPELGLLQDV